MTKTPKTLASLAKGTAQEQEYVKILVKRLEDGQEPYIEETEKDLGYATASPKMLIAARKSEFKRLGAKGILDAVGGTSQPAQKESGSFAKQDEVKGGVNQFKEVTNEEIVRAIITKSGPMDVAPETLKISNAEDGVYKVHDADENNAATREFSIDEELYIFKAFEKEPVFVKEVIIRNHIPTFTKLAFANAPTYTAEISDFAKELMSQTGAMFDRYNPDLGWSFATFISSSVLPVVKNKYENMSGFKMEEYVTDSKRYADGRLIVELPKQFGKYKQLAAKWMRGEDDRPEAFVQYTKENIEGIPTDNRTEAQVIWLKSFMDNIAKMHAAKNSSKTVSIDKEIGDEDGGDTLGNMIADENSNTNADVESNEARKIEEELAASLGKEYVLGDDKEAGLRAVGKVMTKDAGDFTKGIYDMLVAYLGARAEMKQKDFLRVSSGMIEEMKTLAKKTVDAEKTAKTNSPHKSAELQVARAILDAKEPADIDEIINRDVKKLFTKNEKVDKWREAKGLKESVVRNIEDEFLIREMFDPTIDLTGIVKNRELKRLNIIQRVSKLNTRNIQETLRDIYNIL